MSKYRQTTQRRFSRIGSGTSLCLRYRVPRSADQLPRAPRLNKRAKHRLAVLDSARGHG